MDYSSNRIKRAYQAAITGLISVLGPYKIEKLDDPVTLPIRVNKGSTKMDIIINSSIFNNVDNKSDALIYLFEANSIVREALFSKRRDYPIDAITILNYMETHYNNAVALLNML
jgi:hypothetical protein